MQTPNSELCLSLLAEAPLGIALFDDSGRLAWCNPALATLAGRPLVELPGLAEADLLATEVPLSSRGVVQFASGGRSAQRRSTRLAGGPEVIYYLDATEQEALSSECEVLADQLAQHNTVDPVSGLLNQQGVVKGLEPLVSRSRRYDNFLTVVTMSLNNLAAIGAERGEAAADAVVLGVGQLLRDQLRWADLVGRLDNGDFIFVLPETDQAAAQALADKIAKQLRAARMPVLAGQCVEACFGVSQWARGDDTKQLIRHASEALAQAVREGPSSVATA